MEREDRYLVIKRTDLDAALEHMRPEALDAFNEICTLAETLRRRRGKTPMECVVVEHDWPEYEATWAAIEKRVDDLQGDSALTGPIPTPQEIEQ